MSGPKKRGVAQLEFIMMLVVLLPLVLALLQIGMSMSNKASVTVAARHDAWRQRYESNRGEAFDFQNDGSLDASAAKEQSLFPIMKGFAGTSSRHTITSGSWDYRRVKLNRHANLSLAMKLGSQGPGRELQGRASDVRRLLGNASAIFSSFSNFSSFGSFSSFFKSGQLGGLADDQIQGQLDRMMGELAGDFPLMEDSPNGILTLWRKISGEGEQIQERYEERLKASRESLEAGIDKLDPLDKSLESRRLAEQEDDLKELVEDRDLDYGSDETKKKIGDLVDRLEDEMESSEEVMERLETDLPNLLDDDVHKENKLINRAKSDMRRTLASRKLLKTRVEDQIKKLRMTLKDGDADDIKRDVAELEKRFSAYRKKVRDIDRDLQQFVAGLRKGLKSTNESPPLPPQPNIPNIP